MWDMDHLSALGILNQPWEGDDPAEFYAGEKQRIEKQHRDMTERLRTMNQERNNAGRVAIRLEAYTTKLSLTHKYDKAVFIIQPMGTYLNNLGIE
ncbi:hypothetical protein N7452_001155 [Penicillium brevicompactum]|uniref:Uncharacterized protein n=1 Tax=Penicillium brevicompactum TaxID=5074 RepID=A0A9W9URK6_PENBR|nr:hypothetical protein N7452_001155 [Penicillium brevicompactum]